MAKKRKKERISIFIDAANIFYSQKSLGWRVDYKKFLSYWQSQRRITGVYFYTAVILTKKEQLKFFRALEKIGYTVITREVKVIHDRKNKKMVQKGNFDVKMAIDIVLRAKEFDVAILASGDSDFEPVVEHLRSVKKKVVIVSARGHVARELVRSANQYMPLEKLKKEIMRQ